MFKNAGVLVAGISGVSAQVLPVEGMATVELSPPAPLTPLTPGRSKPRVLQAGELTEAKVEKEKACFLLGSRKSLPCLSAEH